MPVPSRTLIYASSKSIYLNEKTKVLPFSPYKRKEEHKTQASIEKKPSLSIKQSPSQTPSKLIIIKKMIFIPNKHPKKQTNSLVSKSLYKTLKR